MKIVGTGIDIVENSRIKKSIKNDRFIERIFSKKEISISKMKKNRLSFYAKRYAAKEAFVKSLGTGFRDKINFKDITIVNDKLGKPSFLISENVKKFIKKKFKTNIYKFFLSITDEKNYSIAMVIFQK